MSPSHPELLALICFSAALVHCLNVGRLEHRAHRQKPVSLAFHFLHHLSEIEVVFGLYAFVYLLFFSIDFGAAPSVHWLRERNFSGSLFIAIVMITASMRPILILASRGIQGLSRVGPHFGCKASLAILCNAAFVIGLNKKELLAPKQTQSQPLDSSSAWITTVKTLFLALSLLRDFALYVYTAVMNGGFTFLKNRPRIPQTPMTGAPLWIL